ncbi:MAG TPA: hypothetical protein VK810_03650 [Dongiaceae bacterium]|nr:hypothetical protein [Dongiaceae bacterium]
MNEFEQKLSRQSLKQIPGEWRAEILIAAKSAVAARQRNEDRLNPNPILWLRELFWPHPKAWAGLAAVWVAIVALDLSTRDDSQIVAKKSAQPSPEIVAEVRQQKLMFAQLIGSSDMREAEPPKFFPRPRTERVEVLMT